VISLALSSVIVVVAVGSNEFVFGRQYRFDLRVLAVIVVVIVENMKLPTGSTEKLQHETAVGELKLPLV
jgi:hypothetical protein